MNECIKTKFVHVSSNSKLLFPSFDIPIKECSKSCEYAISNLCYAKNNPRFMVWLNPKLTNNEKLLNSTRFVSVLKREILLTNTRKFRFFSCGDLYKSSHLDKIIKLVESLPFIQFWLSTHSDNIIFQKFKDSKPPINLNIILSNKIPNQEAPGFLVNWLNERNMAMSTTTNDIKKSNCHSSYDKTSCGLCDKCFSGENIVYFLHGKHAEKRLTKYQAIQENKL